MGPFKYYVIMFLTFLGPPTFLKIYSTANHQKLPLSDPTHPPLWWRILELTLSKRLMALYFNKYLILLNDKFTFNSIFQFVEPRNYFIEGNECVVPPPMQQIDCIMEKMNQSRSIMALPVVEFSRQGYKIGKVFP